MKAILSVSDKTGLIDFARGLAELGVEIYSTGGTHRALDAAGIPATVHLRPHRLPGDPRRPRQDAAPRRPRRHPRPPRQAGPPARSWSDRASRPSTSSSSTSTPSSRPWPSPSVTLEDALENIDIGGPTLLRAAAKNFPHVLVLVDPADYAPVLDALQEGEGLPGGAAPPRPEGVPARRPLRHRHRPVPARPGGHACPET